MPEIDTELFQQIVIGLLILLLLVALLVLNTLGKIRKALDRPVGQGEATPVQTFEPEPQPQAQPAQAAPTDVYSQPWGEAAPIHQQQAATTGFDLGPAPMAAEPIPEEQPFERDGRWWFKRGDELLVYDEGTGQWTGAPSDSPVAQALRSQAGGTATAQFPTVSEGGGGFWKCPSCGAVNGSTSATCRMCFTPRPA
jgi:hypothetical protein